MERPRSIKEAPHFDITVRDVALNVVLPSVMPARTPGSGWKVAISETSDASLLKLR